MLSNHPIMAFLATRDGAVAREFFEGKLGLRCLGDNEHALEFDVSGTSLRIQKVKELTPHPFTSLGWVVPDITVAVRALVAKGVVFERYGFLEQDDDGVWATGRGAEVAWFKDPDGNTLSLTQLP